MSTVPRYEPGEPLVPNVKAVLAAEARALERSQSWWCEPVAFVDSPQRGFHGRAKVFLAAHSSSGTGEALEQRMRAIDAEYASRRK